MSKSKRVFSVQLPEPLAEDLEMVARIEGKSMGELIRDAVVAQIETARADKGFQQRLRERIEADQRLLDRLT